MDWLISFLSVQDQERFNGALRAAQSAKAYIVDAADEYAQASSLGAAIVDDHAHDLKRLADE